MTGARAKIIGGTLAAVAVAVPMGSYYEGVFPVGYADPVGVPTECVGETGPGVRVGVQRYTWDECVARYAPRLQRVWDEGLSTCVRQDVTVQQGAALISWADNVGLAAACRSTLVRLLNAGAEPTTWCAQLTRWDKATLLWITITLPGLTKRRASELAMCLGGDWRGATGAAITNTSTARGGA